MNFDLTIANIMLEEAKSLIDHQSIKRSSKPHLVVLGGQPGSGKSSAIEIIEAKFNGNIISLNGDDFKRFYPNYIELLQKDPDRTATEVQPYSNYIINELKKEFLSKKYNIVIEGTMRTSEVPLATIADFKHNGYVAEAYIVASNYYASRAGCLKRMELEIATKGSGRAVPIKAHDDAYNNIPSTLQKLIKSKTLANITIISRSGKMLGQFANGDDVLKIYESHRAMLSTDEYNQINDDLESIIAMMNERKAAKNMIQNVAKLQKELTNKMDQNQTMLEA